MTEKIISKFPQYLAEKLKDVYFKENFDFLTSIEEKNILGDLSIL